MNADQDQAIKICIKWFNIVGIGLDVDLPASEYIPAMPADMAAEYDADMATLHGLDVHCVQEEQLEALAILESRHDHRLPVIYTTAD